MKHRDWLAAGYERHKLYEHADVFALSRTPEGVPSFITAPPYWLPQDIQACLRHHGYTGEIRDVKVDDVGGFAVIYLKDLVALRQEKPKEGSLLEKALDSLRSRVWPK